MVNLDLRHISDWFNGKQSITVDVSELPKDKEFAMWETLRVSRVIPSRCIYIFKNGKLFIAGDNQNTTGFIKVSFNLI